MSLAKDVEITSVGMTPNPVNASSIYLAQVGAQEVTNTWGTFATVTWGSVSNRVYG